MPLGFGEGLASGNFFKVKAVSDRSSQDRVNETVLFVLTPGLSLMVEGSMRSVKWNWQE